MENGLKELLESQVLNEEVKKALLEAWTAKIDEVKTQVREQVETQVREEYARLYEDDKSKIVEAMDLMISESIEDIAKHFTAETKALQKERAKLTTTVKESRAKYAAKLNGHVAMLEEALKKSLVKEVKDFRHEQKRLIKERAKLASKIQEADSMYRSRLTDHRKLLAEKTAERLSKLEDFNIRQITKELAEFNQDKQKLVETRVKMVNEGRQMMLETKKAFLAKSAQIVEAKIDTTIDKHVRELREDIRVSRENMFGRKIFEQFAAEFMTSYLSEGTQVKKLGKKLDEAAKALEHTQKVLAEKDRLIESAEKKAKLTEERAQRASIMSELLSNITADKRVIMSELLATTRTGQLREAFHKYLPAVLNETSGKRAPATNSNGSGVLLERKTVEVTGNRRSQFAEVTPEDQDQQAEIINIRRLAGLEKIRS